MIPRGTLDIGWRDLIAGALRCGWSEAPERVQRRVEAHWPDAALVACLSVRSGLDLLLQALALPRGSEVIVSAITIPDMVTIIEHHGLVPVPVDIDPATLSVDLAQLRELIEPQTRAILVAHLFGSRMPLTPIVALARQHGLLVIEDCAQAYDTAYRGHPESDVSLFSFGPIKTATALGGALVRCIDPALATRLRQLQACYPRQPRRQMLRRIVRFGALKLLARPRRFAIFVALCRLRGVDHDQLINAAVRSFGGQQLMPRLRQQPSAALLHLLERRLCHDSSWIAARVAFARRIFDQVPELPRPGATAEPHTHWVLPIESRDPDALTRVLWAHGFDATRKASSMTVVQPSVQRLTPEPCRARQLLAQLVYLPMYPALAERDLARLAQIVRDVEIASRPIATTPTATGSADAR